jgi:oxalate decarboxylase/phosphoglucose isomerase-like protein (cupin superfamily)
MGEWFTALSGEGQVVVEDPNTGERAQATLNGQRVYVPAGLAHALFNTGDTELLVLACADASHDPADIFVHTVSGP